ncbi:MAG: hypothetical protein WC831_01310 [Parcubacteria group bacterium]|jgi:hypothetical protein
MKVSERFKKNARVIIWILMVSAITFQNFVLWQNNALIIDFLEINNDLLKFNNRLLIDNGQLERENLLLKNQLEMRRLQLFDITISI